MEIIPAAVGKAGGGNNVAGGSATDVAPNIFCVAVSCRQCSSAKTISGVGNTAANAAGKAHVEVMVVMLLLLQKLFFFLLVQAVLLLKLLLKVTTQLQIHLIMFL